MSTLKQHVERLIRDWRAQAERENAFGQSFPPEDDTVLCEPMFSAQLAASRAREQMLEAHVDALEFVLRVSA